MSTLPGGPADKAGLVHEALWGVYAMLRVLQGHAREVRIEPPGVDGAEFYVETKLGREYWQAKRQLLSQDTWSLTALNREGVLEFFLERLRSGEICVFASITDAPGLRVLGENACEAKDFAEFQSKFLAAAQRRRELLELCQYWGGISESNAFEFLLRTRVEGARETTIEGLLLCILDVSFEGSPHTALDCLQQLYLNSVHKVLDAEAIRSHLESRGIKARAAGLNPSLPAKVLNLTESYLAGQRAKLIRGKPISRALSGEIAQKVKNSTTPLDIALIASAGGGKSACLLEIVSSLQANGMPVLAFRLDRVQAVQTTIKLGEELGLPESPAVVLNRCYPRQSCALVIDQLDFVSSTSGRHPDFFDTVAALVEEVRGLRSTCLLHLVLACRKFDFQNDHRLRSLLRNDQPPVELPLLSESEVKAVVSADGGNAASLFKSQVQLLQLPQNLSLFMASGLAGQSKPAFASQKDLFDAYWDAKQRELSVTRSDEVHHWKPIIDKLTTKMSERQELSVPKSQLDGFPWPFISALISMGVLSIDGNRIGFGHESLFDYCFARTIASGAEEFVTFLEKDEQQLFRRAQLRQVLAYLRDDDFKRYLDNVRLALTSSQIRPHLRLLVFELLGAVPEPRDEELLLLMPFIDTELDCRRGNTPNPEKMASRAFDVFFHSSSLFKVADRMGYIHRWINSGEEWLADLMMVYFRRQTEGNADMVAEIADPFVGRESPWPRRLRFLMNWPNHYKGRKFFELLLRLIDDGTLDEARDTSASNGTFWSMLSGLAEHEPQWCAEVAAHWLDRQVFLSRENQPGKQRSVPLDDDSGVEDLFTTARNAPKAFLVHVLPAILRAADATKHDREGELPHDGVWIYFDSDHLSLSAAYLGACETAFEELAKVDLQEISAFIGILRTARLYTANFLLQHAYLAAPQVFAQEAIALLVAEPERLFSGFSGSEFRVTRRIIDRCSSHCTEATLGKLETVLLNFTTPYERSKEGFRARGFAAFGLISALSPERRSRAATARLEELERKFGKLEAESRTSGVYTVVSPITKESAEHMADENWLRAIARYNSPRIRDWKNPAKGGASELSGMLKDFTEKDPERFARLALKFPEGTNPSYFMNVLYAIRGAQISPDLKVDVVRRAIAAKDDTCIEAGLDVVGSVNVYPLPEDIFTFIKSAAVDHPDPSKEEWDGGRPQHGGDMLTCGLNTVRGHASGAIRDLIFYDRRYLDAFLSTLDRMVNDKSLAVRSCVASTLLAVARYETEIALRLFAQLTSADDRLLGTRYLEHFMSVGLREHFDNLRGYIERMLRSGDSKVKQAGGRLACLARLYHPIADDLAEAALAGDEFLRLGAAGVAEANLTHGECRDWCETALARLFDDPHKPVRHQAARCFWHFSKNTGIPLESYDALIGAFLKSKAFVGEPSMLLHALEETKQRVPETTLQVCEKFIDGCAIEARDIRTSLAADEYTIGALVFRSYAQLQTPSLRLRALSLIDRMCEEGLQSASKHLLEFER